MYQFPKDKSKIRSRIRRYERELRKEKELHGFIHDGGGKRHRLGIQGIRRYRVTGDNKMVLR